MRIKSFLLFITIFFLFTLNRPIIAQEVQFDTINNKLILNGEMGYITKEVGFPFLLRNKLITKSTGYGEWKEINPQDTIGKYFKIDSCNHYLVCLPKYLDRFSPKYWFFELDSTSQIIKKEIFNLGNMEWDYYYKEFRKYREFFYFSIHHGDYDHYSIDVVYFNQLTPLDSLDKIRVFEYFNYHKLIRTSKNSNIISYNVYSWSLEKMSDSNSYIMTCYYYIERGCYVSETKFRKGGFIWYPFKRKIKVRYIIKNNKIETLDQKKLKRIEKIVDKPSKKVLI